ncbi:MAG TPA: head GIN domain-containing protein [Ramlibacter sp.]|nr:head GIN domain-containing protein [Ramlibacter sp.]
MNPILRGTALFAACVFATIAAVAQEGQMYTPGPFDSLDISGVSRIELAQGERDQVFVVGDQNAQRSVKLSLHAGNLRVRNDDSWKFWNNDPVQLRIQMRDIKRLLISGASDINAPRPIRSDSLLVRISGQGGVRLADLGAKQLNFMISGAGEGELGGKVGDLQLNVSGKGKLIADKLKAVRATVHISGIGNADVWATDDLNVIVSGIGTVNYWGLPRVHRISSGMSEVNAKGDKK